MVCVVGLDSGVGLDVSELDVPGMCVFKEVRVG